MIAAFGKKTKGCFSSKARFAAVSDFRALVVRKIVTAHRVHGVCPARLAAFFSEERGCAALCVRFESEFNGFVELELGAEFEFSASREVTSLLEPLLGRQQNLT